ncbi:MAG: tRNA epoxyqueuosine(34) reductase QueG [Anaeromyxobacter sp.]|nr:tRNA epoxyqueuosine(34) reductase QueG [Anaeromyxobacter sp.]MBL0278493.1 tRNA epoxyqueuosine(34) reductase QueG [Anaeromyxobacter sp.]
MPPPLDSPAVKAAAHRAGFHEVGVARAAPLDPGPLDHALERGYQAEMAWLSTQRAERLDPARLLPGVRSVVALALSYRSAERAEPGPGEGRVARYARGRDYHAVLKKKLKGLVADLAAQAPGARFFPSADVAPVMEKAWAERAGLGWVGKNGCLITPRHGSWVLLATLLTDLELEPDAPARERCGTCQACLPACPTGAIPEPGYVDARRCLSFWTIERRGPLPDAMMGRLGGWVFGCDDCQVACPWNAEVPPSSDPELLPREGQAEPRLEELLQLTPAEYARRFHGTALARARQDGLQRNAALLAGESGDARWAPLLRPLLQSPHEGVRAAAAWALERLGRA